MERTSRRRFLQGSLALAGLSLLSGCGIVAPGAYQPKRISQLGLFHVGLDHIPPSLDTLREELRSLGHEDGQTIALDWRNLPDEEAARDTAREFVRKRMDLIVAFENQTIRAAKAATSEIPIVFLHADDPVANGFVQSIAHPGGNLTGLFNSGGLGMLTDKRIELFKDLVPPLRRLLILSDPQDPTTPRALQDVHRAAALLQLELVPREGSAQADFERIFSSLRPGEADGIFAVSADLQTKFTSLLIRLAAEHRLPLTAHRKEWVEQGALFSYGPDIRPAGRAAAHYVDKILKGAKPADLPVAQADVIELVINKKTADALGLTMPQSALGRADRVIQ